MSTPSLPFSGSSAAQSRVSSTGLPTLPSLAQLGLSLEQLQGKSAPAKFSDGTKKVAYNPTRPRDVRPFQSKRDKPARFTAATAPIALGSAPTALGSAPAALGSALAAPGSAFPTASAARAREQVSTTISTSAIPTSRQVEKAARSESWKAKKSYPNMKITAHGETIATYIQQFPIFAVDSPTGTGKTRYLPYLMATKGYIVRVAIPTTVAVRDAYRFQREHTTLQLGYAAGREIHYSDDAQLVYATTGHITQRIIGLIKTNQRDLIKKVLGDVLFVDEVHTATSQITLLIGLIKYLYTDEAGNFTGPKIIFSTATFNQGDITDYFSGFPIYQVELQSFPITEIYLDKPRDLIRDNPNLEIEKILRQELATWKTSPQKYHAIIFRPGVQEVEDTLDYLQTKFSVAEPIEFYPAYSQLNPAELDEIFQKSDKMKVIVGTNIIESSITVEDVGVIIDDMLEKIAETSATGGNKLTLTTISKAGSQQRRGRTGRTVPGRDYRLLTSQQYAALPPFRLREIDRVPIYDIVLQLIDAGLNPRDVLKISIGRYEQARRLLVQFGMIEQRADRYLVTEAGRFVSLIPLGVQNAYMIYLAYQRIVEKMNQGVDLSAERILLRTVIAVASMIESFGPSYMFIPRKQREETNTEYTARRDAHIEKYHEKFRGPTDIHTFVNIFWEMLTDMDVARKYDVSTRNRFTNYVREWSVNNSMNNKKVKEYLVIMRDVESIVEAKINDNMDIRNTVPHSGEASILPQGQTGEYGFSIGKDLPDGGYGILGNATATVFAQAYIANQFIRNVERGKISYVDRRTGIAYKIDRGSSFSSLKVNEFEGPTEIVAARTVEVVGKAGGRVNLASIVVPIEYFPKLMRPQEITE